MAKTLQMQVNSIQLTQLYISSFELDHVMKILKQSKKVDIEPIPVKKLSGQIIFVDGHTRALAAFLFGISEIPVYYWKNEDEDKKLDWDEYKACIEWCKDEGIHTISDLKNRIVPDKDYQVLWLDRCKKMQQDLEAKRKTQKSYKTFCL